MNANETEVDPAAAGEAVVPAVAELEDDGPILTAEQILAADDLGHVEVYVKEWKGKVRIRQLNTRESIEFSEAMKADPVKAKEAAMRLLLMSAIKRDGTPLFEESHFALLKEKSLRAILHLQKAALELNGMTKGTAEEAKNV